MTIGFTTRSQTVSEGDAPSGVDLFSVIIEVEAERSSERDHTVVLRHLASSSTAIVQSVIFQHEPEFDALFGIQNTEHGPLEERSILQAGEDELPSLLSSVRNDFRPEEEECYSIGIFAADTPGISEVFTCNDRDNIATNFFCVHTICIEDDDGKVDL